jgi:hypothetical protein
MRRLHGRRWRAAAAATPGRLAGHLATTTAGLLAAALGTTSALRRARRPRPAGMPAVSLRRDRWVGVAGGFAGLAWLGLVAEFAWARVAPGPRTWQEVRRMVVTSVLIPPAACAWRLRGELRHRLARAGGQVGRTGSEREDPAPGGEGAGAVLGRAEEGSDVACGDADLGPGAGGVRGGPGADGPAVTGGGRAGPEAGHGSTGRERDLVRGWPGERGRPGVRGRS